MKRSVIERTGVFKSRHAKILVTISLLVSAVFMVASYLAYQDRSGSFLFFQRRGSLTHIQHETGFNYVAMTNHPELSSHKRPSLAHVLENGKSLPGPANAMHEDIRKLGEGRFSFWHNTVYFSTSDNSDPRVNGRTYEIFYPIPISRTFCWILYGVTALSSLLTLFLLITAVDLKTLTVSLAHKINLCFTSVNQVRGGKILLISLWVFSIVLIGASFVVFLNRTGTLVRSWQRAPITNIQPETDFAYIAATQHPELSSHENPSLARVLEDGVPLPGPDNSLHDDIRKTGRGRFSFWHDVVYFSTSDNSDPRTNGRSYEIFYPKFFGSVFARAVYGLTFLVCIIAVLFSIVVVKHRKLTTKFLWFFKPKVLFAISCAVVTLAYLIPRLPWFVDYPLAIITYDTRSYFEPVRQMFSGKWPDFVIRTPGYPLFLAAAFLISSRLTFVIVLQNLLTLASALFFVWVVYKIYGRLVIGAALSMIAHVAQPLLSGHDFMLMTESLFTSCLVFCLGLYLLCIHTKKPLSFFLLSAVGGYAILVRPAGAFLAGSLLLIFLYIVINHYPRKSILCLVLPMPTMLVVLMTYNYIRSDFFTISSLRAQTLYAITAPYWEEDEAFPEMVNTGIRRFRTEIREEDRQILQTSWNPVKLNPLFANAASYALYRFKYGVFSVTPGLDQHARMDLGKQVAQRAILSHPEMAVKFFWATLCSFLLDESSWQTYLYSDMGWIAKQMDIEGIALDKFVGREYAELPRIRTLRLEGDSENKHFVVVSTSLSRIYFRCGGFLRKIFDNKGWLVAYFVVLLTSLFITVRAKLRHRGAFIVFSVSSLLFGAGMLVALTTSMTNRYPSPTRFTEVLSLALIPLLFQQREKEPEFTNKLPVCDKNPEHTNVST